MKMTIKYSAFVYEVYKNCEVYKKGKGFKNVDFVETTTLHIIFNKVLNRKSMTKD